MEKPQNMDESGSTDPGSPGEEFEPTAEMMVNDFDDEHTLDEEEAMEETEDQKNELSNLEKEKDMPLEALLAMYGCHANNENEEEAEEGEESGGEGSEDDGEPAPDSEMKNEDGNEQLGEEEDEEEEEETGAAAGAVPSSASALKAGGRGEDKREKENSNSIEEEILEGRSSAIGGGDTHENQEDGNSEQYEEEEFIEEDRAHPQSLLSELYKDHPGSGVGVRQLRSGSRPQSEDEEEEDDGDYSPEEDDWKKTIMVGSDYQAQIPEGMRKYGDAPPYEKEDKLLWDPSTTNSESLNEFLSTVKTANSQLPNRIPQGSHIRDDEHALYVLLECDYDYAEALRRNKRARHQFSSSNVSTTMSVWSEDECRNFENGLRIYGKDFFLIQHHKVRTRSVSELVQFYYLWKKTERHDVFANKSKLEKKKYTLHPGTTYLEYRDFMEKFLDEQESTAAGVGGGSSGSHVHSLLSSDSKRRASPLPMLHHHQLHHLHSSSSTSNPLDSSDSITPDEVRILKTHVEDLARHLSPQELESLVHLTAAARVPNGTAISGSVATVPASPEIVTASGISISTENKIHSVAQ